MAQNIAASLNVQARPTTEIWATLCRLDRAYYRQMAIHVTGIVLFTVANIILARTLPPVEFGTFGFLLSLATVLAIPLVGGAPNLLTREVAKFQVSGSCHGTKGVLIVFLCANITFGGLLVVVCGAIFGADSLMFSASIIALAMGIAGVCNGLLKGLDRAPATVNGIF